MQFSIDSATWTFLFVIAGLLILPLLIKPFYWFLIAPLVMRRKQTIAVIPDWTESTADQFTPEMRDFLSPLLHDFTAEGFEVRANVSGKALVNNIHSLRLLLVNPTTGDTANILFSHGTRIRSFVYAIRSRFEDETEIVTGVNRNVGSTRDKPGVDSINFPWVCDARSIAEAHRRRVEKAGCSQRKRIAPSRGEELNYFTSEWSKGMNRQRELGCIRLDEKQNVYRYTLRGAFAATWRLVPPIRRLRTRQYNRRARRTWDDLKMADFKSSSSVPTQTPVIPPLVDENSLLGTDTSQLQYQAAILEGELRIQHHNSFLEIRMGGTALQSAVLQQWRRLLIIGVFLYCYFELAIFLWARFQMPLVFRMAFPIPIYGFIFAGVITFFFISEIVRFISQVRQVIGTVRLTVNPAGIRFGNAPGWRRSGTIPRDDIANISVSLKRFQAFRRLFQLTVRHRATGRRQPLMFNKNAAALMQARKEISAALGIEIAEVTSAD